MPRGYNCWTCTRFRRQAASEAPDEHGEPKSLRDRNPHHEGIHPLRRGLIRARGPHDSEGSAKGQYGPPQCGLVTLEAGGIEAVEPAPERVGIGQLLRQGPQIALGGEEFGVAADFLRRNWHTGDARIARQ